jgi:predicted nuclease of predicted toxin-antitoxin system
MNERLAIFFDCENISPKYVEALMGELASKGEAIIKRAYGDWRDNKLKNWNPIINDFAIKPVYTNYSKKPNDNTPNNKKSDEQIKNSPKNVSDFAIVIDVMNTINQKKADTIVLVSSDSDFTSLAMEIKEQSFGIIGCGERKTPSNFKNACSTFIQLPIADVKSKKQKNIENKMNNKSKKQDDIYNDDEMNLIEILKDAIKRNEDENGYVLVAQIGVFLKNKQSNLIARNYNYNSWGALFKDYTNEFKISYQDEQKHQMSVKIL